MITLDVVNLVLIDIAIFLIALMLKVLKISHLWTIPLVYSFTMDCCRTPCVCSTFCSRNGSVAEFDCDELATGAGIVATAHLAIWFAELYPGWHTR